MKTAVSLPDEVFDRAERLARRLKITRSQLYSRALDEYLARHTPDVVTQTLNRVCEKLGSGFDAFAEEAGRRVLERNEW